MRVGDAWEELSLKRWLGMLGLYRRLRTGVDVLSAHSNIRYPYTKPYST